MENELVDESVSLKKKRGKALPVFCVLSFISIGFGAISYILSLFGGKKSAEEMLANKIELLNSVSDDPSPERIAILKDYFKSIEFTNDNFYTILFVRFIILIVGFLGVLLMYKLKRTGFYLYLSYGVLTILLVVWMAMNAGSNTAVAGAIFSIVLTLVFSILYAAQLKRMS